MLEQIQYEFTRTCNTESKLKCLVFSKLIHRKNQTLLSAGQQKAQLTEARLIKVNITFRSFDKHASFNIISKVLQKILKYRSIFTGQVLSVNSYHY